MPQEFIVAAVSDNRPGVVAAVSEIIYKCGCNIADSSMTLLGNHFSLKCLIRAEGEDDVYSELTRRFKELEASNDLQIYIFPVTPSSDTTNPIQATGPPLYEIKIRGVDREGIIYKTSHLLASRNINIVELNTELYESNRLTYYLFSMRMVIEKPKELSEEKLRQLLEVLADDLNETVSMSRFYYCT
ncbi:MAG: glycine cleavage system protein R [Desulfurivibrionaceae bacterium]